MSKKHHPDYHVVIPGEVKNDPEVRPNAKLLYGDISALCNQEGFCWAKNSYFAEIYGVSNQAISNWMRELEKNGHILRKSKQNGERKIYVDFDYKNTKGGKSHIKGGKREVKGAKREVNPHLSPNNDNVGNSEPKKPSNNTSNNTIDSSSNSARAEKNKSSPNYQAKIWELAREYWGVDNRLTQKQTQVLVDYAKELSIEVVAEAMKIAQTASSPFHYCCGKISRETGQVEGGILGDWAEKGITDVSDLEQAEEKKNNKKTAGSNPRTSRWL